MKHKTKILQLLSEGYTSKEIGEKLKLSNRTVDVHTYAFRISAGAKNTTHLVALWLKGKFK